MKKVIALTLVLASIITGCNNNSLQAEVTPTKIAVATSTPDPTINPPYQVVQDALSSGNAKNLVGRTISGWHGWVTLKAQDENDLFNNKQPYQIEVFTADPYDEELLPNRPWGDTVDPTIEAIDQKLEQRRKEIYLELVDISETQYGMVYYGQEIIVTGTIADYGENVLRLRDAGITLVDVPPEPTPVVKDLANVRITLARGECYGLCPAYSLAITGDGTVTYKGTAYVATCGVQTSKISQAQVIELLIAFRKVDYFSMRDQYTEVYYHDSPYFTTSLTLDDRSKTIESYGGDITVPTKLYILLDRIDEIVNSSQWIGKVSHDSCSEGPSASPTP